MDGQFQGDLLGSANGICCSSGSAALSHEEEHFQVADEEHNLKVLYPTLSGQAHSDALGPLQAVPNKVKKSGTGRSPGNRSLGLALGRPGPKTRTDIDGVVAKLASEAAEEVKRLRAVNGLAVEETRNLVRRVLQLFRSMIMDQNELRGKAGGTHDDPDPDRPTLTRRAVNPVWNARLLDLYTRAKNDLEKCGSPPEHSAAEKIVGKFLEECTEELNSSSGRLNAASVCVLLHRTSSLLGSTSERTRTLAIETHEEYLKDLLNEVNRRLGLFDHQGYASLIWSFGKLGYGLNSLTIGTKSFATLVKDLLQAARNNLSRFTVHDSLNMVLGLAGLKLPQETYSLFVRGLMRCFSNKLGDCSPHDILSLLWAIAKLEYLYSSDLVAQMCQTVENRLDEFTVAQISSFLRGMPSMQQKGVASLTQKVCKEMEAKAEELDLSNASKLVWALLYLAVHPGEVLMSRLGNLLAAESSQTLTPQTVMYSVLALAHRGQTHGPGIEAAKAHFINNYSAYSPENTSKFVWALAMMDALDVDLLNAVGDSPYGQLSFDRRWEDDRLHLSQVLISWRILNGQPSPEFVTHETEEACYKNWKDVQRSRTAIGLVPEVIKLLSSAGFVCHIQQVIENVPLSITSATKERSGIVEGLNLSVEVRTRSHSYLNYPQLLKPRQRWRQRVLEASGWTVIQIPVDRWNKLPNYAAKTAFLHQAIYAKTSIPVQFPEKHDGYDKTEGTASARAPTYSSTAGSQMGMNESEDPSDGSTLIKIPNEDDSDEISEPAPQSGDNSAILVSATDVIEKTDGACYEPNVNEEEAMLEEMEEDLSVKGAG